MSAPQSGGVAKTEHAISTLLRIGVSVSLILISLGTILSFAHGGYGSQPSDLGRLTAQGGSFPRTLAWLSEGLRHMDGQAVIVAGLLLLIATPVLRVAVSIGAFARERDRTYVLICTTVLLLLIISFALGRAG
jgi:uncharacterized membrane protein